MALKYKLHTLLMVVFLGGILSFSSGCRELVYSQAPAALLELERALLDQYRLALGEYFSGDVAAAAKRFAAIEARTTDPLLKRRALFGLACARLVMAGSADELAAAQADWQAWTRLAPQQWPTENPLLFGPLVAEKIAAPAPDNKTGAMNRADPPTAEMTDHRLELELKKELQQTRSQLEESNRRLAESREAGVELKREIAKLKEQLKAIELIDQKMQEKKKAIPEND